MILKFVESVSKINDGFLEINDKILKFIDSFSEVDDSILEFIDSFSELNDMISELDDTILDLVDSFLEILCQKINPDSKLCYQGLNIVAFDTIFRGYL